MTEHKYEIVVEGNVVKLTITPLPLEDELEAFLENLERVMTAALGEALVEYSEQEFERAYGYDPIMIPGFLGGK